MHWNILDKERADILPLFGSLKDDKFYLAGGTALALQIGHRDSIDFDFFTPQPVDTNKLFEKILAVFKDHRVAKVQDEPNTLGIIVDESIKMSFMSYDYELLRPLVETEFFPLASIADIICMKFSAITSRSVMKDYVDIYFILKQMSLKEALALCSVRYPSIDTALVLKSLVYFEDIVPEPIMYKEGNDTEFEDIKDFLRAQVKGIY